MDADNIAEIHAHNGLSGNQFTITENPYINLVAAEINALHPYLWFGMPYASYVYYLQCFDASSSLICSLTVANDNTLSTDRSLLLADCTELRGILEQLETWHTVTDRMISRRNSPAGNFVQIFHFRCNITVSISSV